MAGLVIDADGHVMEQHQDLFAHIKGNFGEMNWHSTWPMFDADGWQRGLSRKGKREDPDAEAWIRFQNENGIDCAVLYPTSALALGMIQLPAWASALAQGYNVALTADVPKISRVAGLGIVMLARESGRPIFPVAIATSLRIELDNWDRSAINLPFGRGALVGGERIRVPADAGEATLESYRLEVEAALNAATARAYTLADQSEKDRHRA